MNTQLVITANRTKDGRTVYLGPDREWVDDFSRAQVLQDTGLRDDLLAWARSEEAAVCDPYATAVQTAAGGPDALTTRERIRAHVPEWITERYAGARAAASVQRTARAQHPPSVYRYDELDQRLVRERAAQFRDQVRRRLSGEITEAEFKPLRLQNGLYMQLHAYMLRIAVPYGQLSSRQLYRLADITRKYDLGYGHFTTRQNIQLNWIALEDVPSILDELAEVEMHAIQTSGNCVRNVTSDPFAGVARDEIEDPRPYAELLRQWSTFHPEFAHLPRKFKIAITGAAEDRAAIRLHDIGLRLVRSDRGEVGFEVIAGGGLGRSPYVGPTIREFLPKPHLLSYCEAILRVYNRYGRRDNKFKARIKVLVDALGPPEFARKVEEEWEKLKDGPLHLESRDIEKMKEHFIEPRYEKLAASETAVQAALLSKNREFAQWVRSNVFPHRVPGYSIVALPLKNTELPPGDLSAARMDEVASIADQFGFGRLVVTHRQNLVLPDVETRVLCQLWESLTPLGLTHPNMNSVTDVITCPGLDYCALANARSIPVAEELIRAFQDVEAVHDLSRVTINLSGCINACGHHHVGNIGILGIDKRGVEYYQLMLGGSSSDDASLGRALGPALPRERIIDAVKAVLRTYVEQRTSPAERFIETYRRIGAAPFAESVYGSH